MSAWTTPKVNNLFAQLRKLLNASNSTCDDLTNIQALLVEISQALGGSGGGVLDLTNSNLVEGAIDNTQSISGGAYATALEMRHIEVQSDADGKLEIVVTKGDGSVLTFRTFGTSSWRYEGRLTESPIIGVTVTNVTGIAGVINVILNVVSRA